MRVGWEPSRSAEAEMGEREKKAGDEEGSREGL